MEKACRRLMHSVFCLLVSYDNIPISTIYIVVQKAGLAHIFAFIFETS